MSVEDRMQGRPQGFQNWAVRITAALMIVMALAVSLYGLFGGLQLEVAALFSPLRRRVQALVDRRFYRAKYDMAQTLAGFARVARGETDLEALTTELVAVVQKTMQPHKVSVWLLPDARQHWETRRVELKRPSDEALAWRRKSARKATQELAARNRP